MTRRKNHVKFISRNETQTDKKLQNCRKGNVKMRSRERETAMNSDFRDKLSNAATVVEITLGMVILIACIVSGIGMVAMTDMNKLFGDPAYLQARMSSACLIIIGIELIKMITSYTIDSVVDVMLLAIARQMIVEHT